MECLSGARSASGNERKARPERIAVIGESACGHGKIGMNCKILRIITRMNIGGPAIHSLLLARGLAERGYDTTLVAGYCEPSDGDMSYLLTPEDPVHWIPEMSRSVRPWNNLEALWKLWRLMRSERPLIVHTHTAMAGCLGHAAALLGGVPIVIHTFHGNRMLRGNPGRNTPGRPGSAAMR